MTPRSYRQGDILLIAVDQIPTKAKIRKPNRKSQGFVLAEGEVTGHHHVLEGTKVQVLDAAEEVFAKIMAPGGAVLDHPEHGSITIPPGTYRVVRQREYQPKALPRRVAD